MSSFYVHFFAYNKILLLSNFFFFLKQTSFLFFFLWKVQLISAKRCSCAFLESKNVDIIYHRVGICMTVYNSSQ